MYNFDGKVVIVTGSTDGIGFEIAKQFGLNGAKIVISSRKQNNVDNAVEKFRNLNITVHGVACHVGNAEQRQKLVDSTIAKYGRIDIFVSNAGINPHFGDILDVPESVWDKLFDINVKCGFLLSKLIVPHMERNGGGSIMFVASIAGYVSPPGIAAYGVTKTALLGLTKALAASCASKKIRVNCIAPGLIKTKMSGALLSDSDDLSVPDHVTGILLNRVGTPEDCAGAALFLCSKHADYITGETVCIGGGLQARL